MNPYIKLKQDLTERLPALRYEPEKLELGRDMVSALNIVLRSSQPVSEWPVLLKKTFRELHLPKVPQSERIQYE